jgi:hypothetical protein
MKTRHKWLLAIALAVTVAAWLAWTMLTAERDLAPQGRLPSAPRAVVARQSPNFGSQFRVSGSWFEKNV